MAVTERDVVLMSQSGGGQSMDYPITRLRNIEATAEVKSAPAEGDYIPLLDGADSAQMKKVGWSELKTALGGGESGAYELAFSASNWTAGADGYTITIPKATHGRSGRNFGCRLWHSVDGVLKSDTWAVVGTVVSYNSGDGSITLTAGDSYDGVGYFYDL